MTRHRPCPAAPGPLEEYAAWFDDLFSRLAQRRGVREYLAGLLAQDEQVRAATLVVRFETLCEAPAQTLGALFEHVALPEAVGIIDRYAPLIRHPDYYTSRLTAADEMIIHEATAATARGWGY